MSKQSKKDRSHYEIEADGEFSKACPCCGVSQRYLTRYVFKDGVPWAAYKTVISDHPGHSVEFMAFFGDFGRGVSSETWLTVGFRLWTEAGAFQMQLLDAEDCFEGPARVGVLLDASTAKTHKRKRDFFKLSDVISLDDEDVIDYLERPLTLN